MIDLLTLLYASIGLISLLLLSIFFLIKVIKYYTETKDEQTGNGQEDHKRMRKTMVNKDG